MTPTPPQNCETAKSILTGIYLSAEVKDVIKRLRPVDLQEDILQHCFLELFQKPPDFIIQLHDRGKLKAYIVKILHNTATYNRTSFTKQFGKETPTDFCTETKYEVIRFENEENERIETYREIDCAVSTLGVTKSGMRYTDAMLKLYAELGTYKAVSEKTGIPQTSVFNTIKEVRKAIRKQL